MLELKNIGYSVNKTTILKDINLTFKKGYFNALLGANGAGKSTLLKIATGVLTPSVGATFLEGKDISTYSTKVLSMKRAVLSQHFDLTFPLSVHEVVMMGRYPHFQNTPSVIDRQIVENALEKVDMLPKIKQNYMTLSGGEKQKVQMARVLAQIWNAPNDSEHKYLFLDEPTTSLDIRYQLQILDLAKELLAFNTTVVAILHDLNLSFKYGNQFYFLKKGALLAELSREEDVTEVLLEDTYNVKVRKWRDETKTKSVWDFRINP